MKTLILTFFIAMASNASELPVKRFEHDMLAINYAADLNVFRDVLDVFDEMDEICGESQWDITSNSEDYIKPSKYQHLLVADSSDGYKYFLFTCRKGDRTYL